jgi:hypothetical protein
MVALPLRTIDFIRDVLIPLTRRCRGYNATVFTNLYFLSRLSLMVPSSLGGIITNAA